MTFCVSQHNLYFLKNSTPSLTSSKTRLSGSHARSHSSLVIPYSAKDPQNHPNKLNYDKVGVLKQKMELVGIHSHNSCLPGLYTRLLCPKCKGGNSMEKSLSLHIMNNLEFATWRCYNLNCGWAGQVFADNRMTIDGMNRIFRAGSSYKEITPKGIALEPLGAKLIRYFGERMISKETLQRNDVMQMVHNTDVIAFTYRKNGAIVGCKYRTMKKRFWQEKGTARWLYGLDDIVESTEIILVEGEIDKLSMEEAGFHNCVSVPGGAPRNVSTKDLPSLEKDKAYHYLWNCKSYLDKLSRIILATDSDGCGKALAEELARRLGKERCWVVRWPKKDDSHRFNDANEVLRCLGPYALKQAIDSAELYH